MVHGSLSLEGITKSTTERPSPEQVWIALAHCYRALNIVIERTLQESGLSLTDFMLLEALLHKGPLTITAIRASVLLASGSMTAAVDRLEKKGLIVRNMTGEDRRARLLDLTAEGKRLITDLYQQHRRDLKQWLDVVGPDERAVVFRSLRKIERRVTDVLSASEITL